MSRQGSPQRSERASRESLSGFIQSNGRTPRASDAVGDRGPSITPSPRGTTLPPIRGSHSELTRSQTRASDPGICLPPLRPPPSKSRIPAPPVPQPGVVPQYPRPRHARPHSQLLPSPRVSAEGGRWTLDEEPSSRTARGRSKGDGASLQDTQRVAMLAALDYQEILYVVVKGAKVRSAARPGVNTHRRPILPATAAHPDGINQKCLSRPFPRVAGGRQQRVTCCKAAAGAALACGSVKRWQRPLGGAGNVDPG